jgi:hypothetical protein
MKKLKRKITENLFNIPGWRTKRHIIVLESDDWGSIRMPSKKVYDKSLKNGYRVDNELFTRFDSLASEEDLSNLFELLLSYKDINNRHPVLTANCLIANPDFLKIRESDFKHYHFELITDTFKKYPKHNKCFELWKEGLRLNVFIPQNHGREHLNVSRFMSDLQAGDRDAHFAFNHQMPGIFKKNAIHLENNYVVSLEYSDNQDKEEKNKIIEDGLLLFKDIFSYSSKSFIATNYVWHTDLESLLQKHGVRFIQGTKFQYIPKGNYTGFNRRYHYIGQTNGFKQIYLTRNVFFEPTLKPDSDCVDSALRQIEIAFRWQKPAIISTHRINYVGFIDVKNRDRSLNFLKELLKEIIRHWSDVEFMSTVELGNIIKQSKKN